MNLADKYSRKIAELPIVFPLHVVPMLRDDGIVTLEDWQALGNRRFRLFGITARTIEALDQAVREARG